MYIGGAAYPLPFPPFVGAGYVSFCYSSFFSRIWLFRLFNEITPDCLISNKGFFGSSSSFRFLRWWLCLPGNSEFLLFRRRRTSSHIFELRQWARRSFRLRRLSLFTPSKVQPGEHIFSGYGSLALDLKRSTDSGSFLGSVRIQRHHVLFRIWIGGFLKIRDRALCGSSSGSKCWIKHFASCSGS